MSLGEFIPSSNTLFLYHLNGNSNDSGSNGLNGTDTSVSYSLNYGKFNQGAYLNGSGQIRLGNSTILQPLQFTISMWVKRTTTAGSTPTLIMRDNGLSSFVSAYSVYLTTTTGYIRYEQQNGATTTVSVQSTVGITDTTNWHHICVTRNPSEGTTRIYLDSVLVGSGDSNTTAPYYGTTKQGTTIGAYIYGSGSILARYTGYIDEIFMLNNVWSNADVLKYYTNAVGRYVII